MDQSQIIKARIELPCSIRFYSKGLGSTSGVTEELSRESLVVIAFSVVRPEWLSKLAHIAVGIELPHSREFRPRLLECAATVSGVHPVENGLRIAAKVNRMCIKDREPGHAVPSGYEAGQRGLRPKAASEGTRNTDFVIRESHLTKNLQQGEYTMSFVKKLFVEEDGQDMVEYGLVLGLVVLACASLLSTFQGKISTGFSSLGASVAGDL